MQSPYHRLPDRGQGRRKGARQRARDARRGGRWLAGLLVLVAITIAGPAVSAGSARRDAASGVAGQARPAAAAALTASARSDPQAPPPQQVRIEHHADWSWNASKVMTRAEEGWGTAVGPHTILTHGHYAALGDPRYMAETMILSIHGHGASTPCPVQVADIAIPLADQSTALLILPDRLPLPDATALGDPEELQPGDPVSILYWEDTGHRLATLETTIARIESGVATVGDPDRLIGRGDSGSGVYDTQGRLVGNVWSIVAKSSGERLPWVVVGLLPAGIAQHIS